MKKISMLFIIGIALYGCEGNILNVLDNNEEVVNAITRVTDIDYTFSGANFSGTATFDYNYAGENQTRQNCALYSYTTFGNVNTNITPEVINLPSWCTVSLINESTLYFVYKIGVSQNNSSERSGYITFKQPESNKTVSVKVVQYDHYNRIAISVKELYSNHPVFTATTTYPVKKDISCRIPYEAYNDGGKYDGNASITIPKGETKGTYEMDYNGSPLVDYHGDIKGYKLYEGTTTGDDIYTYSFVRYW